MKMKPSVQAPLEVKYLGQAANSPWSSKASSAAILQEATSVPFFSLLEIGCPNKVHLSAN